MLQVPYPRNQSQVEFPEEFSVLGYVINSKLRSQRWRNKQSQHALRHFGGHLGREGDYARRGVSRQSSPRLMGFRSSVELAFLPLPGVSW